MNPDPKAIRPAAADAISLARLQRSGTAWLVVAWPATLPPDPLEWFNNATGRRSLFWHGAEWLLAHGQAASISCDGPGRGSHLAQELARLESRCVISVQPSGGTADRRMKPRLPCVLTALAFEETPTGPGPWGEHLPGAHLWLPRVLHWQQADGSGWTVMAIAVTATDHDADAVIERLLAPVATHSSQAPGHWPAPAADFAEHVEDAVALIADGAMRKVVLARAHDQPVPAGTSPLRILRALRSADDQHSTLYAHDLDNGGLFLGSSPEVLFSAQGLQVTAMALAGTSPRGKDAGEDASLGATLISCTKQRKEHGVVVEHLTSVLRQRCRHFAIPTAPHLRPLGRLIHLETVMQATLLRNDYLELVCALHPTPAVCGLPTTTAIHYIARHEHLQRGLYSGAFGWLTPDSCRFIVPLRGGLLHGDQIRLFAGAGIVETSEGQDEFMETELKFTVMRQALGLARSGAEAS